MKTKLILAFTIALAATLLAQTAAPPSPPSPTDRAQHHVQFLTTVLGLNTTQQQQALTIFSNAASAESTNHDAMKTARQTLQSAIVANNTSGIDQAATVIGQLMTQETSTRAKADAAFYQILTADQQTKLTQLQAEGPGRGHGFGFGGPPPGRP